MTSSVVAIVTCERCGQVGQTTAHWQSADHFGDGRPHGEYWADSIEAWDWRTPLKHEGRVFKIGVTELKTGGQVYDYPGESDDLVLLHLDLCPTCRMAFLTWWLEGRP